MARRTVVNSGMPRSEREAILYEQQVNQYVSKHGGQYLKADNGSLHLVLENLRISLSFDRDNHNLARLILNACGVSSLSAGAQAALQRLQVTAQRKASSLVIRNFATLSPDRLRFYIPEQGSKLLKITSQSIEHATNGDNEDKLWVEHPHVNGGCPAFKYLPDSSVEGLARFEKLIVDTQSCRVPAMRWLVAMHEAFFPFARDVCRARFLLAHIGGTQQGKTTGAQRS